MARVLLLLPWLFISLQSFANDHFYDPFRIEIIRPTAVRQGYLRYEEKEILRFLRFQEQPLIAKIENCKKLNKKLVRTILSNEDQKFQVSLAPSDREIDDQWETINYKDIIFSNGGFFSHSFIKYQIGTVIEKVDIFHEEIEEYLNHIIAKSHREKIALNINISALKSKHKQHYLRGKHIAYFAQ